MITDEDEKLKLILFEILKYIRDIDEDYSKWCIGITIDPLKKQKELEAKFKISFFKSLGTGNKAMAKGIEKFLINKGIKKCRSNIIKQAIEKLRHECTIVYVYKNES